MLLDPLLLRFFFVGDQFLMYDMSILGLAKEGFSIVISSEEPDEEVVEFSSEMHGIGNTGTLPAGISCIVEVYAHVHVPFVDDFWLLQGRPE